MEKKIKVVELTEGRPEVGLFWIEPDGNIIGIGSSDFFSSEVIKTGPYINYFSDHSKFWPSEFNTKYPGKGKEYFSKGRVSKREDIRRFIVELPTELENNTTIKQKVLKYFSLPPEMTDFKYFQHHDKGHFRPGDYK